MKPLLDALRFLTIIPVNPGKSGNPPSSGSLIFFPLIGAFIGCVGWLALWACFRLDLGAFSYAIVPVVALAALTGGLHLDGLCDTADALLSRKPREEMLAIMRDPRCGALGVTALISAILLKVAFLASVPLVARGRALVLACAASRWSVVLLMYLFQYARKEGKVTPFIGSLDGRVLLAAAVSACVLALVVAGTMGLLVLAVISLSAVLMGFRFREMFGGITGDTLGASSELTEISALLLSVFIL